MITRMRGSKDDKDQGFTLIELLVVMIIIGILAAIAIPVFLSQRTKARDTSTKADVSTLGKEIATYYVDGAGALTVALNGQSVDIKSGATVITNVKTSKGTALQATNPIKFGAAGTEDSSWCVALTNPAGDKKDYYSSAAAGLNQGVCP